MSWNIEIVEAVAIAQITDLSIPEDPARLDRTYADRARLDAYLTFAATREDREVTVVDRCPTHDAPMTHAKVDSTHHIAYALCGDCVATEQAATTRRAADRSRRDAVSFRRFSASVGRYGS